MKSAKKSAERSSLGPMPRQPSRLAGLGLISSLRSLSSAGESLQPSGYLRDEPSECEEMRG